MHKIGKSGGVLGRLLRQLLKTGLPLMKSLLKLLAKSVLILSELTAAGAAAAATDPAIKKKFGSGMTTLIISNEEMNDIMNIVKSLEEYSALTKGVREKVKNEAKDQKRGFLGMLLDTLGTSLLGNLLTRQANMPE